MTDYNAMTKDAIVLIAIARGLVASKNAARSINKETLLKMVEDHTLENQPEPKDELDKAFDEVLGNAIADVVVPQVAQDIDDVWAGRPTRAKEEFERDVAFRDMSEDPEIGGGKTMECKPKTAIRIPSHKIKPLSDEEVDAHREVHLRMAKAQTTAAFPSARQMFGKDFIEDLPLGNSKFGAVITPGKEPKTVQEKLKSRDVVLGATQKQKVTVVSEEELTLNEKSHAKAMAADIASWNGVAIGVDVGHHGDRTTMVALSKGENGVITVLDTKLLPGRPEGAPRRYPHGAKSIGEVREIEKLRKWRNKRRHKRSFSPWPNGMLRAGECAPGFKWRRVIAHPDDLKAQGRV